MNSDYMYVIQDAPMHLDPGPLEQICCAPADKRCSIVRGDICWLVVHEEGSQTSQSKLLHTLTLKMHNKSLFLGILSHPTLGLTDT